jgi:hypothetical protein
LTIFKAPVIYGIMSGMLRFASAAATLIFRLVIVVSLAGYSLSSANAAMHPQTPAAASQIEADHTASHGTDHAAVADEDHHGGGERQAGAKDTKPDCCQDYCGVAAIDCDSAALAHPRLDPVLAFIDDNDLVGLAPRLHLPPNI